jgi:hypothetical protein
MHRKKIEEECLKLKPAIDEMSEQFTFTLETASDISTSDTVPNRNGEMGGLDHLDS